MPSPPYKSIIDPFDHCFADYIIDLIEESCENSSIAYIVFNSPNNPNISGIRLLHDAPHLCISNTIIIQEHSITYHLPGPLADGQLFITLQIITIILPNCIRACP